MWAALSAAFSAAAAEPSTTGQTGLVNMPDARFAPEGSWRTGYASSRPYSALWSSMTVFPWFEADFRYTRIWHVPPFTDPTLAPRYGEYKDKSFDAKVRLLPERGWLPQIAVGAHDVGGGTGLFRAYYGVASKQVGDFDFTLGYGSQRIDGAFGGVRWTPSQLPSWSVVAERDAFDYRHDPNAQLSGADQLTSRTAVGVEYRWHWLGAKVFTAHGNPGANVYLSVPLDEKNWIPKWKEPQPYTKINPRPTEEQWRDDAAHRTRLARALVAQDFRDVRIGYEHERLEASLTNIRISSMPRAVGRAARTMLSFAPLETREIRVTYREGPLAVATYTFIDARLLQRYFNGMATRRQLRPTVAIEYAKPGEARDEEVDTGEALQAFQEPLPQGLVVETEGADFFALRGENVAGGRFTLRPSFSTFFNDPSGAFRYDLAALATYDRALGRRTFLSAELRMPIVEDVSGVTTPSNSELPHVRTDIAEYRKRRSVKLNRLVVNRFGQAAERVYWRGSAGVYEEMFSGFGGQALYLGREGAWGVDLDANWLKQREFNGWFGTRDYSVVTAIASLNYRMAQGTTGTLRAGRFLAKDEGVRAEMKRRFASGWEVGAWYTVTNGHDITSPGTPSSPYHDKGIFIAMPLETLLPRDTRATAGIALSPWTRDVGQMVASPGDLYSILENPVTRMRERDGLSQLGDRGDDYELPQLGADRRWPDFLLADLGASRGAAGGIDWGRSLLIGGAITLSAAALDKPAERFAKRHEGSSLMKNLIDGGDALPTAALGLSALFAFDESRPGLSDAGVAALEAGGAAFLVSTGLKYAVGRARPDSGQGIGDFDPGSKKDEWHSFPSRHTAVMWAAVTPYAEEYGMPWLYGVAALTNAARIGSREHWVSDTVGSSLLGYALGHIAWQARRESRRGKNAPQLSVGPGSVAVAWPLE